MDLQIRNYLTYHKVIYRDDVRRLGSFVNELVAAAVVFLFFFLFSFFFAGARGGRMKQ